MVVMDSRRVTDSFPQRKRIAHQPRDVAVKPGTSKSSDGDKKKKEFDILKQFDLTLEYGPCIGITRMERWERAQKHDLNPPQEVKEIIDRHRNDESYTRCLWNDYNVLN